MNRKIALDILQEYVGKTVLECRVLGEAGEVTGIRFVFSDGTAVQAVFDEDEDEDGLLVQRVEG